jgi:glycosyltransferase involved in cell wall biosynthesis
MAAPMNAATFQAGMTTLTTGMRLDDANRGPDAEPFDREECVVTSTSPQPRPESQRKSFNWRQFSCEFGRNKPCKARVPDPSGVANKLMTSPSVSVVIPCFNQGRFLRDALDSVFAQTMPASEVVVVDDGSTDRTSSIAASYSGVTCVRQPNRGLAHARNRGLRQSRGDYLVFLDADDRLLPDAIAIGAEELDRRPDHALVFGRCERIDESGQRLPTVPPPPFDGDAYETLLRNNVIWTPAVAMFRRLTGGPPIRFDPSVGPAADYDLYLRLARRQLIDGHGRLVAEYRLHSGSMSRDAALMLRSTVSVLRSQRRYVAGRRAVGAWEYGLRGFKHHYGDLLVAQIRSAWRDPRKWGGMLQAVAVLLRYHPGGVVRQSGRHLQRLIARAPVPRAQGSKARARRI